MHILKLCEKETVVYANFSRYSEASPSYSPILRPGNERRPTSCYLAFGDCTSEFVWAWKVRVELLQEAAF